MDKPVFKLLVFVFDVCVRTIEDNDPNEALVKAKTLLPSFASQGPVTLFEFDPLTRKWSIIPHAWQDWSDHVFVPF